MCKQASAHIKGKVAASAAAAVAAANKRKGKTALLWLNVLQTAIFVKLVITALLLFVEDDDHDDDDRCSAAGHCAYSVISIMNWSVLCYAKNYPPLNTFVGVIFHSAQY